MQPPRLAPDAPPATLEDFFRRYSSFVAKLGFRLLGRDTDVDDLVQDVFVAAHRGIARLENRDAARAWLATVTVRLARRRLRTRKLRGMLSLDATPDYMDVADESATPEQRAILAGAYRVLDELPANQRIAWTLRYVEGEPLERVAELCQCSLATAKRRIAAAKQYMEEVLGDG